MRFLILILSLMGLALSLIAVGQQPPATATTQPKPDHQVSADFPKGTATPSEECGTCHQAIYREFAYGFGADLKFKGMVLQSSKEKRFVLPGNVASGVT